MTQLLRGVFQIMSDLHMEFVKGIPLSLEASHVFFSKYLPKSNNAEYLILAGDICPVVPETERLKYSMLMQYCNKTFKKTFVVAGNHEYYGGTIAMGNRYLEELCNHENIVFLNRKTTFLPEHNLAILGTTLWSETRTPVAMNDYQMILQDNGDCITHYDTLAWHREDVDWLSHAINAAKQQYFGATLMCITHHLPSYELIAPQWIGSPINSGFASHLDDLVKSVNYWICGHTHTYISTQIGQCQVRINPRGYPRENVYRSCTICIPPSQ